MSLFFNTTTAGALTDPLYDADLASTMNDADEVYVAVHGWNTTFDAFCQRWNQFGSNLSGQIPPSTTRRSIALHWPSTLSEENPLPAIDLATFWEMEKRADVVGQKALADLIRSIVRQQRRPIRLVLIGHSFGCKVICAALEQLATERFDFQEVCLVGVLLQAAFESDALEPGQQYGQLVNLPLRIMASRSDYDTALLHWFPMAAAVAHPLSALKDRYRTALGGVGPSDVTKTAWGSRLRVSDFSSYQKAGRPVFNGAAGSHGDVLSAWTTSIVAQYIYGATTPTAAMRIAA